MSGQPSLHQSIAADIALRIASGKLQPGDTIPSETKLMAAYGVARVTARGAMRALRESGLVETHQGRSTTVCHPPSDGFSDRDLAAQTALLRDIERRQIEQRVQVMAVVAKLEEYGRRLEEIAAGHQAIMTLLRTIDLELIPLVDLPEPP